MRKGTAGLGPTSGQFADGNTWLLESSSRLGAVGSAAAASADCLSKQAFRHAIRFQRTPSESCSPRPLRAFGSAMLIIGANRPGSSAAASAHRAMRSTGWRPAVDSSAPRAATIWSITVGRTVSACSQLAHTSPPDSLYRHRQYNQEGNHGTSTTYIRMHLRDDSCDGADHCGPTWAFSPNPAAPIPPSEVIYQPQHWNAY